MSKQNQLEQIKADIIRQNICPNLAQAATNLVMSRGDPDAKIVFIGEAPGKNEDLQGQPFVGAAGKLLDEVLQGIGLKIDDVYITNIVKYRPPNNRDPSASEKKAFWPFLVRELSVVQPKIIATLGRHSMEYFLPGQFISQIHGQLKRIHVQPGKTLLVLPLYHPAAALYSGGLKQTLLDDFAKIPTIMKLIKEGELNSVLQ